MSAPLDASAIPRRSPLLQSAIEQLQDADDAIRRGRKDEAQIALVVAQAAIQTQLDKLAGGRL